MSRLCSTWSAVQAFAPRPNRIPLASSSVVSMTSFRCSRAAAQRPAGPHRCLEHRIADHSGQHLRHEQLLRSRQRPPWSPRTARPRCRTGRCGAAREGGRRGRGRQVGRRQDDDRVAAAQLEHDFLDLAADDGFHRPPGRLRPGERAASRGTIPLNGDLSPPGWFARAGWR